MKCAACGHENRSGARFCDACGVGLSAEAAPPASVGDGRYVLDCLLGEGARKRVYLGRDARLDRDVAVAVIKTEGLDDAGRHRIHREARAMARLGDHPHIVTVFDVGEDGDAPFIVSQLMTGGSLADQLESAPDHRLPVDGALAIAEQIARALDHAHGLGIVHRDLKPANVWLAGDGTARLGDFGLAVETDRSRITSEGMVVGTVAYLAPEQAVGRSPDARSDLYALGATVYELLTGRPPFLGDDAVTVISQHLNTAPVAPSWHNADVPPPVERLVLHLLEKDPEQRIASAADVVIALEQLRLQPAEVVTPVVAATAVPPAAQFGRFVGRAEERAQLEAAFGEALSGRGRLVMIVGEPGIGKTRLTEELATHASVRGAQVCWGHCYEGEIGVPYLPFIEALRTYSRAQPDAELRAELSTGAPEIATLVSDLRERFPDLGESRPLDSDAERLRLFESVATFLHNAAAEHPLLLLLDDLHWADKSSLLLLQHLARNLRRDRVLIVATYRDVDLDRAHPLSDAVAALRREHLFDRVQLRGMSADDVRAFIEVVGEQEPPPGFAEMIFRETEGNPFFVAEILRHLVESGAIARVDGQWVGTPESIAENLPEGVREVIGRRLNRLSGDCNRLLTVGAAMPGGFIPEVASDVVAIDEDRVLDLLDEATEHQVLRERPDAPGVFEFTHALIRQTLYGELNTPRRVRLHRQIGAALEERHAGAIDAHLGELAYHFFQGAPGGDVDRAVTYAVRAAERANAQTAHEETARYYGLAVQAAELAATPDDRRRAELLLELGRARRRAGDAAGGEVALVEALELARSLDDGALFARVVWAGGDERWYGTVDEPETLALLDEALERLGTGDISLRARLLTRRAALGAFLHPDRFRELIEEAVGVARESGDPGTLAYALSGYALVLAVGENERWAENNAEVARLADEVGDVSLALSAINSSIHYSRRVGDRRAHDEYMDRYGRMAREYRSPWQLANVATLEGSDAVLRGEFERAEVLVTELLEAARRLADPTLVFNYGVAVTPMRREQGRLGELEGPTRRVVDSPDTMSPWKAGLVQIFRETGAHDEAAMLLEDLGRDRFAQVPDGVFRDYTLCSCAEVAAALGDRDTCEVLAELLAPTAGFAAMVGFSAYHGAVDRYRGLAALALGRVDEAVARLEAAETFEEQFGAWMWLARTRFDLARALVARDEPGDRNRAIALLNDALDAANEIGMPRLVEEVVTVKLELQGATSSSITASIDVVAAAVSIDRPNLASYSATDGRIAILFSDIEGYSAMTERVGDERSQDVLRAHNAIVRRETGAHGGTEVKSAGDGFMLAFPDVADALRCALDIQRAIEADAVGGEPIRVRIGVHVGEVIREEDDFFGTTVIRASRVANEASGGEVLVTEDVRVAVKDGLVEFGDRREVTLKGLSGQHVVYAITAD